MMKVEYRRTNVTLIKFHKSKRRDIKMKELGLSARGGRFRRKKKPELKEEQVKEFKDAFELFDSEKTGYINYHELKVVMRALGFNVKKREVLTLIEKVGRDDIGKVDMGDFLHISTYNFY